ncbi:MAG: ComEC/Rec2 family competence protein, partial [bacterium]|nr:ComEC/Rec2 family competence protein [bacterium]
RWISFQFRARRSKNYEAYTEYLLNNFCKDVAEIEKKDADLEFRNSKSINNRVILFLPVFIVAAGFGIFRYEIKEQQVNPVLENLTEEKVIVEGVVTQEPDKREESARLSLSADTLISGEKRDLIKEGFLIITPLLPEYGYGSRLRISGTLQKPENFENENGREFDYVSYLAKDNIRYQMFFPEMELLSTGNGFWLKEKLFSLKNSFVANISRVIPEPASALAAGLIVGAKQSLGEKLLDSFRVVGLIHIVVLSGYNIMIVAGAAGGFIKRVFSNRLSLVASVILIFCFSIMVGAGATVVRASIMALLSLLARATGRIYMITHALVLAGASMILWNPKILVFDPSFQLSFVATLGVIYGTPVAERWFKKLPKKWSIREIISTTIAVQIFVLPMILWMMGELSFVAPFANALVLPLIPMTMLFGALTGALGWISFWLSVPFGYIAYAMLWYELRVTEIFASLPFASVSVPYFPFWLVLVVYFLFAIFLRRWYAQNAKRVTHNVKRVA